MTILEKFFGLLFCIFRAYQIKHVESTTIVACPQGMETSYSITPKEAISSLWRGRDHGYPDVIEVIGTWGSCGSRSWQLLQALGNAGVERAGRGRRDPCRHQSLQLDLSCARNAISNS